MANEIPYRFSLTDHLDCLAILCVRASRAVWRRLRPMTQEETDDMIVDLICILFPSMVFAFLALIVH